jgi:hypothetical protein
MAFVVRRCRELYNASLQERRASSRGRATCLFKPDLFWLRPYRLDRLVCSLTLAPSVGDESASGPERGKEQRAGWACPSGSRGVGCGREPSIPFLWSARIRPSMGRYLTFRRGGAHTRRREAALRQGENP